MEPLKEMFNKAFYDSLAKEFKKVYPSFNAQKFVNDVTSDMEALSLNERMRNTSVILKKYLPGDLKKSVEVMKKVIPNMKYGYTNLVFPDFVGLYGLNDFDTSLDALKYFTLFGSSEFAIRVFLKHDFTRTIKVMYEWAKDKNHHVRRLSSEGSRPRLPWSFKLDEVIKNPSVTKPILETLKSDDELYVRKSVANHLNDISKENPDYMLNLIKNWDRSNPGTTWIIRHASRTLIKKGHSGSLSVLDFEKNVKVEVSDLKILKPKIKLGESLSFSFDLSSKKQSNQKLVVDYIIHYRKKKGALSPKVFKLKEIDLKPGQKIKLEKKQLMKDFTTRKHEKGEHLLEIQVNGKVLQSKKFHLSV
jgi:3-methyladenine DNA glycosylase AlkC